MIICRSGRGYLGSKLPSVGILSKRKREMKCAAGLSFSWDCPVSEGIWFCRASAGVEIPKMKDRSVQNSFLSNHSLGLNGSAYQFAQLACDVRLYDNRGTPNMKWYEDCKSTRGIEPLSNTLGNEGNPWKYKKHLYYSFFFCFGKLIFP